MQGMTIPRIALLSAALFACGFELVDSHFVDAQRSKSINKTFTGPNDSEFPYPTQEGKMGQSDPAALAEINQSVASSLVPEHAGLEVTGTLTSGPGDAQQQYPVSFVIDNGRRFRLDIQKPKGTRTLRIDGDKGKAKQGNDTIQELEDIEFVNPLGLPSLLQEIAGRKDASVVDDGVFVVKDHSMNKVTITLFRTRFNVPVSASFYFDSATHTLEKGVFVEHSLGNRSLKNLMVMTYGGYRKDQSVLLPHEYSETINGQLLMTLKVTTTAITPGHDNSYFSF